MSVTERFLKLAEAKHALQRQLLQIGIMNKLPELRDSDVSALHMLVHVLALSRSVNLPEITFTAVTAKSDKNKNN